MTGLVEVDNVDTLLYFKTILKVHFVTLRYYFYAIVQYRQNKPMSKFPFNSEVAFESYAHFTVLHLLHIGHSVVYFPCMPT